MYLRRTPVHTWLSRRVRLACLVAFGVSLFLPPYIPESSAVPDIDASEQTSSYLLAEDGFLVKTSALTEQGTRGVFAQGIIHIVEANESIASIANMSDVKPETIIWANGLKTGQALKPGQKLLVLPVDGVIHSVKRGQNLSIIAELYGIEKEKIVEQNQLEEGYLLAGQELIIPGGKPVVPSGSRTVALGEESLRFRPNLPNAALSLPGRAKQETVVAAEQTFGIMQRPCNCFFTQYFGSYHYGVDLQQRGGGPIFAAEDGTVIRADYGWNGGYGNVIEVDHGNGIISLYAHNKELRVKVGDLVSRGDQIASMGNTGLVHGPTGIHLHFEVHVNGIKKNPILYLQE